MNNKFWQTPVFGTLAGVLVTATLVWAVETMEVTTYYPPSGSLPDPFRVQSQTVGTPYLATTPPADSLIIAGPLGVRTNNPSIAAPIISVDIGPRDAVNSGGALRLLGAGANRWFYLENDTGRIRFFTNTDDTGAAVATERMRIMETGFLGIYPHSDGLALDPQEPLHLGPRDPTDLGGQLMFVGADTNGYFHLENNAGRFRLMMQDGVNPDREVLRTVVDDGAGVLAGSVGIFVNGTGVVNPTEVLHIGAESAATGARIHLAGTTANPRYAQIRSVGNDLQFWTDDGAGSSSAKVVLTNAGGFGIGSPLPTPPAGGLRVDGNTVIEGDLKLNGIPTTDTMPGVRILASSLAPSGGGLIVEPATTTVAYGLYYQTSAVSDKDLVIGEYDAVGPPTANVLKLRIVCRGGLGNITVPPSGADGQTGIRGMPIGNNMFTVIGQAHTDRCLIGGFTYTAGYALKVFGDALATGGWTWGSSVAYKTDLARLTSLEERGLASQLMDVPLYNYQRKEAVETSKSHRVGILVEEAMDDIVDDHHEALDLPEYMAALIAVVKAQQEEIESLRARIGRIRKEKTAQSAAHGTLGGLDP